LSAVAVAAGGGDPCELLAVMVFYGVPGKLLLLLSSARVVGNPEFTVAADIYFSATLEGG
jgi:hypothetical protein